MKILKTIGAIVGVGLLFGFHSCNSKKQQKQELISVDTVQVVVEPELIYGFPVDSFHVEEGTVKNNQFLSQILNKRGVGMGTIDQIARKSKSVFDVRKIKSGGNFVMLYSKDSIRAPKYFVYENTATEYFIYQLTDTLGILRGEKEIHTKLRTVQGVLKTSLWNDMSNLDQDPVLSLELSEIFAWTIDFFAIQKGDRYRVIYDGLYVDSTYIGIGDIHAVQFDHYGEENFAFLFNQNDTLDYFDEKGQSLRKSFLKAPLQYSRVSSGFSHGRMHPILRIRRPHHGVDYAAARGTPVMSIGDGTVIARAYQKGGGGNYVKIKHNGTYTTTYMHLQKFAKGLHVGQRVRQKDVIGYVGSTGISTGPHLDFRVHMYGKPIDPLRIKADPVAPVKKKYEAEFVVLRDSLLVELNKIRLDLSDEMAGI